MSNNSTSIFKKLDSFFITLLSSQIFLIVTAYYIASNYQTGFYEGFSNEVKIVVMTFTLTSVLVLRFYYNYKLTGIKKSTNEKEKIEVFYNLNINRMIFIECISLINLVSFHLTSQSVFIIISIILTILFIIYRPTEKSFNFEMNSTKIK